MNINQSFVEVLVELLDNSPLAWGLIACGFAQVTKIFFEFIKSGKLTFSVLIETGGMPSSHSALVSGTAAAVGLEMGFDDPIFALASTVAFVVMYDASGIRRSAGLIAKRVNQLSEKSSESLEDNLVKENLGHSRLEVLVGSLLGPAIVFPGITFIGSPLHAIHNLSLLIG